jgi:hypothetical protein
MIRVCVKAKDYSYYGEVVGMVVKRSGLIRYVVEDENGRLFIHGHEHLGLPEGRMGDGHIKFAGQLTEANFFMIRALYHRLRTNGGLEWTEPDGR